MIGDEDIAIDFHQLYQEEKRKIKEERLLRRIELHLLKGSTSSTSRSKVHPDHQKKEHHQDQDHTTTSNVPAWTWESEMTSQLLLPSIPSHTSVQPPPNIITTYVPNMIHYSKDFIFNASYRDALVQWLYQLPENDLSSASSFISNRHNQTTNNPTATTTTTIDTATTAANGKWTVLPHAQRRVALFDATLAPPPQGSSSSSSSSIDAVHSIFPPPLQILIDTLIEAGVYNNNNNNVDDMKQYLPNHILINEYVYAHQGILPHTDGPAYHSKTITISLGMGNVLLQFTPMSTQCDNQEFQMVLHGNGSLIIFENDAYTNYYHSINDLSSTTTTTTTSTPINHLANQLNDETSTVEWTGTNCYNAASGTCVTRQPHRISITIRHKLKS